MTTLFNRAVRGQGTVSQQEALAYIALVDHTTDQCLRGAIGPDLHTIREIASAHPSIMTAARPVLSQLATARYLAFADDYDAKAYRNSASYPEFHRFLDSNPFNRDQRHGGGRCPMGMDEAFELADAMSWARAIAVYARCLSLQMRSGINGAWRQRRGSLVQAVNDILNFIEGNEDASYPAAPEPTHPLLSGFSNSLRRGLQVTTNPGHFLEGRLSAKINYAVVHHRCAFLNGRNLADWFQSAEFSVGDMLQEMRRGRWLDSDKPENSRFFRMMTDFGKPMHGVFDAEELAAFAEWARLTTDSALPTNSLAENDQSLPKAFEAALNRAHTVQPDSDSQSSAMPQRCLFRALVESPVDAGVQGQAHRFLETQLDRVRNQSLDLDVGVTLGRFAYSPEALAGRVDEIYDQQQSASPPRDPLPVSVLARLHLNSSPVSLVDGCWLGFVPIACDPQSTWGRNLYRIYLEEIGSGTHAYNHAVMFDELLRNLGVTLPDIGDSDYSESPEIPDAYFTVATTMLALGIHGASFLPETLGFTLSVEMFGLGTAYEVMHHQLRNHGMDAAFWTAHISIDNLSNGHSYLAREAVRSYLADLASLGVGEEQVTRAWDRIWDGMVLFRLLITQAYGASLELAGRPVPRDWRSSVDESPEPVA